jgi:hypothetical protein
LERFIQDRESLFVSQFKVLFQFQDEVARLVPGIAPADIEQAVERFLVQQ